jgi:hypothetical protein
MDTTIDLTRLCAILSELNSLTTILAIRCPEYQDRISTVKKELISLLDYQNKLKTIETDSWYVRNN